MEFKRPPILLAGPNGFEKLPHDEWKGHVDAAFDRLGRRLQFMNDEHRRIRIGAFLGLIEEGRPLRPGELAERLDMAPDRAQEIVEELEKRLFFLVRNNEGAVSWAFPVTVDRTPHAMTFSTGERLYAA